MDCNCFSQRKFKPKHIQVRTHLASIIIASLLALDIWDGGALAPKCAPLKLRSKGKGYTGHRSALPNKHSFHARSLCSASCVMLGNLSMGLIPISVWLCELLATKSWNWQNVTGNLTEWGKRTSTIYTFHWYKHSQSINILMQQELFLYFMYVHSCTLTLILF